MRVALIYNKKTDAAPTYHSVPDRLVHPEMVHDVAEALESCGHDVSMIDVNMNIMESLNKFIRNANTGETDGIVFNISHSIYERNQHTHLTSILEMLGAPYLGSAPYGHTLALDSLITKILFRNEGISTPDIWVFNNPDDDMSYIEFPVIVKPKNEDPTFNERIIYNTEALSESVAFINEELRQPALVEKVINGRDFSVGLLGNTSPKTFPVIENDFLEATPYKFSSNPAELKNNTSGDISEDIEIAMQKLSIKGFNALGLRDFALASVRMDEQGKLYLLKVNSMVNLDLSGAYVRTAQKSGYEFSMLVNKMLDIAVTRYHKKINSVCNPTLSDKKKTLPQRIRTYLRDHKEKSENLLSSLININSNVRNVEGVNELGRFMTNQLSGLGFKLQIFPQAEVGNILYFDNSDSVELDILLQINLDNHVPLSGHVYYGTDEQKIYGTGVWSNKGGLAILLASLDTLQFLNAIEEKRIGILLTTDETLQGRFARTIMENIASNSSVVLGLRGGSPDGSVVTSRSGSATYHCELHMKEKPKNENDLAKVVGVFSRTLSAWSDFTDSEKGLVVIPSSVNIKANIFERYVYGEALLSVRMLNSDNIVSIEHKLKTAISTMVPPQFNVLLDGGLKRPAMQQSDADKTLYKQVEKMASKLNISLQKEHRWSSSDIAFVDPNTPRLDGLGPIGMQHRGQNEYILRSSLLERAALLTMIMIDIKKPDNLNPAHIM